MKMGTVMVLESLKDIHFNVFIICVNANLLFVFQKHVAELFKILERENVMFSGLMYTFSYIKRSHLSIHSRAEPSFFNHLTCHFRFVVVFVDSASKKKMPFY